MLFSELSPFASSFSSIIVSEIGDKTFFITAILGMTYSMSLVFLGSYTAMVLMTLLSCFFGFLLPQILNPTYTHALACIMFFYFGQKLLREFWSTETNENDDEEQEAVLEVNKVKSKLSKQSDSKNISNLEVLRAAIALTFLAEWGDRSQITTIALATEETFVVLVGALLGHFICTSTAVLGGKMISSKISEKYIHLCGGILFVLFGLHNIKMLL
ncbi:unnamed protein product [Paramecium pentaurelia]|uniref:GDT1 family protein n=1 Tax=Paramecium pentaurelia TaxID=43138 RepID=A0A8S1X3Y4_9CILI|nr:unnamed protein product [Paramecium pentaurelia]